MCQNCAVPELRLPTDVPGVNLVMRGKNNAFEQIRETVSSTGEVIDDNDSSVTVEVITITRKTLNTQS